MNNSLLEIIKKLITEQGEGILSEPKRVSAFFADLAQDISKPQKNTFIKCLEHGFTQALKDVSENERANCKQNLAQKLHEEEGLDLGLCGETLDLLEMVLFGKNSSICSISNIESNINQKTLNNNLIYALIYTGKGATYRILNDFKNSINELNEAIRLDPNLAWPYAERGAAYGGLGNFDGALNDYSEALRIDPNFAWAYALRGAHFMLMGQRDKAIQDLEKAVNLGTEPWANEFLKQLRGY